MKLQFYNETQGGSGVAAFNLWHTTHTHNTGALNQINTG